jgi:glycosyltransferase involved in cell wall biosynthesis
MFLDVHPEGLIALGELAPSSAFVRVWRALNRWSYRRADPVAALGRDMLPLLSREYGIPETRMEYLPHWSAVEAQEPLPFESSRFVEQWGLSGKFVVQYSGNMGLWHDMETFVRAASRLRDDARIQFVFIGDGIRRHSAERLAREIQAPNIQWRDFVPKELLAESLAASHLTLLSLRSGLEGVAVPCKLYGMLASGRAILAQVPIASEVALTVRELDCGTVVEPGDVQTLCSEILAFSLDEAKTRSMGRRSFEAYRTRYSLHRAADNIERFLRRT